MKIGLVYGSTTGNTEDAAEKIQEHFSGAIESAEDISGVSLDAMTSFDVLIIGVSTWNIGELQQDWDAVFDDLADVSFDGVRVAFFGLGDQDGYPDNFQDAIGILRERIVERGGICNVGHWPTEGYEFDGSLALADGRFVGLALDEDNQAELTEERIAAWCEQLKQELGIGVAA
ncbi:MAG: flavodoxin FldA [Planctomycetota bacterium]